MQADNTQIPAPTPAQVDFARAISRQLKTDIPPDSTQDRAALSNWIGLHQAAFNKARTQTHRGAGATSRQVAYAEKIARRRRRDVPDECYRDAGLMSRWIDSNR
ncbi:MAG: hypothetical protein K8F59_14480 [Rhodobacteraceae bacterium]|nr:hypothetical protein [Paracoccaceae bacterium]